jgi:hypothetical protein
VLGTSRGFDDILLHRAQRGRQQTGLCIDDPRSSLLQLADVGAILSVATRDEKQFQSGGYYVGVPDRKPKPKLNQHPRFGWNSEAGVLDDSKEQILAPEMTFCSCAPANRP